MKRFRIISLVVVIVLVLIVVFQNISSVRVDVFFWTVNIPKVVLPIVTLLIGLAAGLVVGSRGSKKKAKDEA